MCCVNVYLQLKLGQMWKEVAKYLEQAGITPLCVDAQLISSMVQWHHSWGMFIEENQRKLISAAKRAEEILEKDDFARIRDSKLAPTLEALDEVDLIRRTIDRSHMLRMKDLQRRQINTALRFPRDADVKRCHRTFAEKANPTVKITNGKENAECKRWRNISFDITQGSLFMRWLLFLRLYLGNINRSTLRIWPAATSWNYPWFHPRIHPTRKPFFRSTMLPVILSLTSRGRMLSSRFDGSIRLYVYT